MDPKKNEVLKLAARMKKSTRVLMAEKGSKPDPSSKPPSKNKEVD